MKDRAQMLLAKTRSPSSILILGVVFTNALRVASSIVLTRVLGPKELGLSAIIQSIFFTLALLSDAGFQAFVVRHIDGEDPHFLDVIWSVHFVRGVGLLITGLVIGAIIYCTGQVRSLGLLLCCAASTFAIDGAASPTLFTALRTGGVRLLSVIDVTILLIQFATTLVGAFVLHDAWAIVIGMIVSSCARTVLSFVLFPQSRRRFKFDSAITAELWKFSRLIATSSFLTLVLAQIDKLLLATFLTVAAFGVYATASNLATAPQSLAHNYANRIIFPNLSRVWRDRPDRMKAEYYAGRGLVFYGFLFAAGGLIGSAPMVVDVLFDTRYVKAGVYLSYLAVPTAMILLTRSFSECLVATGRPSIGLEMNIGRIVWLIAAGPAAYVYGGLLTFLAVLATVEFPAYLWGGYCMMRRHLLSVRAEAVALLAIVFGVAIGHGIERFYFDVAKALVGSGVRFAHSLGR